MEERTLTEKESLEVITSMIRRTKERYIGDGNIMLMWGYLVAVVSILIWVMLVATRQGYWNWLWFAIPLIGGIATPIMARKQQRESGVKTFSDRVTSRLWTIAGLSEFVAIAVSLCLQIFTGTSCWLAMLAYSLIAMPLAEIAQGLFRGREKPHCRGHDRTGYRHSYSMLHIRRHSIGSQLVYASVYFRVYRDDDSARAYTQS